MKLKELLKDYDEVVVDTYERYVHKLKTEKNTKTGKLQNYWAANIDDTEYAHVFKKVNATGLNIEGETITLQFLKGLSVCFDYNAYKNKVLQIYPETIFDVQLVREKDIFNFSKEDGKIKYTHQIKNPFDSNEKIIGAYCIIKNRAGELIETMDMVEIGKCKEAAKTKYVWDKWEKRMILKSVIKRACKRQHNDITVNIDKIDNENYDLETVEKKDKPLELFKELIADLPNKQELEEAFISAETNDEKRQMYRNVVEIKEKTSEGKTNDNS